MKKGLVIGLAALFIAIAFAPCINANISKTSVENELVEISIEICGIDWVQEHIIQLSEQDAIELEVLFDDMKLKLDNVNTKQETAKIFNDAVLLLSEFGLLPNDMSVEEVQHLVTNSNHETISLNKINDKTQLGNSDNENFDCYIAGKTSNTMFFKPGWPIWITRIKFIKILINGSISLGVESWNWGGGSGDYFREPASGWIWTKGTNGIITWEGDSLWGDLGTHYNILGWPSLYWEEYWFYKGATGFTGITIKGFPDARFFGTASHVAIVTEFPGENTPIDTQNSHISQQYFNINSRISVMFLK